ncbi:MAG TPA: hypothetical protein VK927_10245, partial [Adhaeribacter sp.]|nr:hypothetical protein [Adhaeribacter sp.]
NGTLQNFHINCYTGGFPNLNWNQNGNFESFPPKMQAPADTLVSFQTLNQYLKPLPNTKLSADASADYTVVVFWNRMLGRQSKRLVETVQKNCAKAGNHKIRLVYVNNDNLLSGL